MNICVKFDKIGQTEISQKFVAKFNVDACPARQINKKQITQKHATKNIIYIPLEHAYEVRKKKSIQQVYSHTELLIVKQK